MLSPQQYQRLSVSPSPPGSGTRIRDSRTPPLAPSAAYARRAKAIFDDEAEVFMPSLDRDGYAETTAGTDYRRPRAGTLPSSLEVPQRDQSPDGPALTVSAAPTPIGQRTSAVSPAYPTTPISRPVLRHASSSSANLDTPTSSSRLRSGSSTMPQTGYGNAFGGSPFSNTWLNNPGLHAGSAIGPSKSPPGKPMTPDDEDRTSFVSPSDKAASLATETLNFSTLDYLGLADGHEAQVPASTVSEFHAQAQRAITNSGLASRLRASTVSNLARPYRSSANINNAQGRHDANLSYNRDHDEEDLAQAIENLAVYENGYPQSHQLADLYDPSSFLSRDSNRARATTIGALDNPMRRNTSRNAPNYLASIPHSLAQANRVHPLGMHLYTYPPTSTSDREYAHSRESSRSRGPRLSISSHTSRCATPDVRDGSSTPQIPTRSLWIGNLDVTTTSDALLHTFGPYGVIESIRMLPEKTCAFVNFIDRTNAIRARDDVLNRLGGHVGVLSETAPVRIGFGKIDSAPNGFPGSSVAAPPPGLVFTTSTAIPAVTPFVIPSQVGPAGAGSNIISDHGGDLSSSPTRALWIGSIPGSTSSATLLQVFSPFGPVESARVLIHKCCGFVNFERLESAVSARNALNGRDILGSDIGPVRIGFARVQAKSPVLGGFTDTSSSSPEKIRALQEVLNTITGAADVSPEQQLSAEGGSVEKYRSQLAMDLVEGGMLEQVLKKGLRKEGEVSEAQLIMQVLSGGRKEEDNNIKAAAGATREPGVYHTVIPGGLERGMRRFDAPYLKELRRRLDMGLYDQDEMETLAEELMDACAPLASDYIGNTIIQKLFERVSPTVRYSMLERIAPHLASVGVHKNGTWAAQKIIECSVEPHERELIINNLRAFALPLMCDSLGNYVCAGTLRFGAPLNDYVFDAMVDRMWDIAQNRFGARCMRTCLESPHTSSFQKKRISTCIVLNSIPLATNPNGALLLTWLLEQSNLIGRYGLLANRFAGNIANLCTHKLASLTILRIIAQRSEPSAATTLISAIFASLGDANLIEILSDANNGSQVIGKVIATPRLPEEDKDLMVSAVRRVLPSISSIKASNTAPYRLLFEAVGLPVPAGSIGASTFGPSPVNRGWQGYPNQAQPQGYYGYSVPMAGSPGYSAGPNTANLGQLLIPHNMPLGHGMRGGMHGSPTSNQSPRTPKSRQLGRLSPASQMMSPGSDPFNPFASPSIDYPYNQMHITPTQHRGSSLSQPPMTFAPQPNLGGLGIMSNQPTTEIYYQQNMGLYAQAGYQG